MKNEIFENTFEQEVMTIKKIYDKEIDKLNREIEFNKKAHFRALDNERKDAKTLVKNVRNEILNAFIEDNFHLFITCDFSYKENENCGETYVFDYTDINHDEVSTKLALASDLINNKDNILEDYKLSEYITSKLTNFGKTCVGNLKVTYSIHPINDYKWNLLADMDTCKNCQNISFVNFIKIVETLIGDCSGYSVSECLPGAFDNSTEMEH